MKRQLLKVLFGKLFFSLFVFFAAAMLSGCETTQPVLDENSDRVVTPPYWAPHYDNVSQVQYYYLPDLETYYDAWSNEFIYLDGGRWIFSTFLPPMYSSYDLRSAPVVILDYHVHEPWQHHELYVSHYPRYYFQTVPVTGTDMRRPRGLDENVNKPVFYNSEIDLPGAESKKPLPVISTSPSMVTPNKIQPARYSGKVTGHPVKVDKKMQKPKPKQEKKEAKEQPQTASKPQVKNYKELPLEKR